MAVLAEEEEEDTVTGVEEGVIRALSNTADTRCLTKKGRVLNNADQ